MSYPGERSAWQTIHSPLSSSDDKADAQVRLAKIEETRRGNEQREAEYRIRQGICPACGRGNETNG
jgi:NMD protein affecting ribosome stability and mRNA decay